MTLLVDLAVHEQMARIDAIDCGHARREQVRRELTIANQRAYDAMIERDIADDASQPITPDWLDRCGVAKSTRGSAIVVYQIGVVGLRFATTMIGREQGERELSLTAVIGSSPAIIKTRDQLRSLLEMLGEPELVEKGELL